MKRILNLVILLVVCGNLFSQTPPTYKFRGPVAINATTWKFFSVIPGVNAIVTITGSKNATLDKIDDSSNFAYAWQPFIRITNATSSFSDSSYVEFRVDFQKSSNGLADIQNNIAMTIVDCDGSASIREFVRVNLPAESSNSLSSLITSNKDSFWLNSTSGSVNYSPIDTANYLAMSQINLKNVSSYKIRLGVVGTLATNATRQFSFYFKPFSAMSVPLPVSLISFDTKYNQTNSELNWTTSFEENLKTYEVNRSIDGLNFYPIGNVTANINRNELSNYSFTDYSINNVKSAVVFYRLKMIDENGNYKLSNISQLRISDGVMAGLISIYPNPATEFVKVNLTDGTFNIAIVDAFGKTVQSMSNSEMINNTNVQFDIRSLEDGMYFVKSLNVDGTSTSNKLIKR